VLNVKKCICWCLSIIELKNARWNIVSCFQHSVGNNRTSFDGEITAIAIALQQLLLRPTAFKKAVLLVDSKSAIQTTASNKQATTQIVQETRRTIKLLNKQDKTIVLQWIPSHIGIHGNETADLLAKKRNHTAKQTYNTQLWNNKEAYKTKNSRKILPRGHYTIQQKNSGKTLNPYGKTTKTNQENKQWHFSGSTQVTTVSQHTFITLKFSVITTTQYANKKIQ